MFEWVNVRSVKEKIILTLSKRGASVTITIQVLLEEKESSVLQPYILQRNVKLLVEFRDIIKYTFIIY